MTTLVWEPNKDLECDRQHVSEKFIIKLREYLEPRGHHKREMRVLSLVLTWHAADTRCAEMVTYGVTSATWSCC